MFKFVWNWNLHTMRRHITGACFIIHCYNLVDCNNKTRRKMIWVQPKAAWISMVAHILVSAKLIDVIEQKPKNTKNYERENSLYFHCLFSYYSWATNCTRSKHATTTKDNLTWNVKCMFYSSPHRPATEERKKQKDSQKTIEHRTLFDCSAHFMIFLGEWTDSIVFFSFEKRIDKRRRRRKKQIVKR